jgi:hypothetical protein
MEFKGKPNLSGRPKGSQNRNTAQVKTIVAEITEKLLSTIDIDSLRTSDKVKLIAALMPYVLAKNVANEITLNQVDTSWLDLYSEEQLQNLCKKS